MKSNKILVCAAICACFNLLGQAAWGQQFQKDATWVPESANVIALVRIQDLLDSPLGKAEQWRSKQYHSFKSGLATLPTSASTLLLGAQVDLEYMQPLWQVAVYKKDSQDVDIEKIKQRTKQMALPAQFGSYPGLCVRSDAYIVQVAKDTLVAMEPANRQVTARWLSSHDPDSLKLTPYLKEAISFGDSSSHFIVAIDMNDAVDVNRIKARLANSPLKIENLDAVCESLASIKGVQMAIRVTDKINGAFKVDFKKNPAPLVPHAKTLLLAALERNGFMVSDFNDWELTNTTGNLMFQGTLSNQGFNEIASFVNSPLTKGVDRAIASNQGTGSEEAKMVETTKMYLNSIKDYVTELTQSKGRSLEYRAKFFEKYAFQIDGMFSSDIDPIALGFGRDVANTFREMSTTLRQQEYQRYQNQVDYGVQYERNANAANQDNNVGYGGWQYSGWDGYAPRHGKYTTERVKDQKRIDNFTQKEAQMKMDVMRVDITQKFTDVKMELSKKYETQF